MGILAVMYVRVPAVLSPEAVFAAGVRLAYAFGPERFYIDKQNGKHALSIVDADALVWEEAGQSMQPGETLVQVHIEGSYYGPGYERGDATFILAVARWLRWKWPDGVVLYGGDVSDGLPRPIDADGLWAHFVSEDGQAYRDRKSDMHCGYCRIPMSGGPGQLLCLACGNQGCSRHAEV